MRTLRLEALRALTALALVLLTSGTLGDGGHVQAAGPELPVLAGEVGPVSDDNSRQHPFACRTQDTRLGQPRIDNQEGIGFAVTAPDGAILGYSRDCGAPTIVEYFYKSVDPARSEGLQPLADPLKPPADLAQIEIDGRLHDYIVRYERGTINRFIYAISLIVPAETDPNRPDLSAWNGILVFWFGGGVGIGHQQASDHALGHVSDEAHLDPDSSGALNEPLLERGYAVVSSTATVTSTSYNLLLSGRTAEMLKEQFEGLYDRPRYSFAVGASGGAVQQLSYEQNIPELLDGLVISHAYPDMITQTISVGDCELLEYYFDVTDARVNGTNRVNPRWISWENRRLIEGMNALDGFPTQHAPDASGIPLASSAGPGSSECIEGWRGNLPAVSNPLFVPLNRSYRLILEHEPAAFAATHFSFFDDLVEIFGTLEGSSLARRTTDNVGVQYGLSPLQRGEIDTQEFLLLNAWVGGPSDPRQMVPEGVPFDRSDPAFISPWSHKNATAEQALESGAAFAPRTTGDLEAIEAAYRSGLVFLGEIEAPVINLLPYLEPHLDMHNSRQSFSIRERLLKARGQEGLENHVILAFEGEELAAPLGLAALKDLESWLDEGQRPEGLQDACLDSGGNLLGAGEDVWNGVLTEDPADDGLCARTFPIFSSSRIVAGDDIRDSTFKCFKVAVDEALAGGFYGGAVFDEAQIKRLRQIFPEGVCDYSLGDMGAPSGSSGHGRGP